MTAGGVRAGATNPFQLVRSKPGKPLSAMVGRLASEPRRLWKRYAVTNSTFIVLALRQLVRGR